MDIEAKIREFARKQRIKPKDYPAFREKVLVGLKQMGLSTNNIDMKKYKEVVYGKDNKQDKRD